MMRLIFILEGSTCQQGKARGLGSGSQILYLWARRVTILLHRMHAVLLAGWFLAQIQMETLRYRRHSLRSLQMWVRLV